MKPILKFLAHIRAWPEGARRFAMTACLFFAVLAVFVSWSALTSSRLSKISDSELYALPPLPAETPSEKRGLVSSPLGNLISPLAGLGESFGLMGDRISDEIASVNFVEYAASAFGFLTDIPEQIMKRLDEAADFAAEKLR